MRSEFFGFDIYVKGKGWEHVGFVASKQQSSWQEIRAAYSGKVKMRPRFHRVG